MSRFLFVAQHISIESRNSLGQTKHTGAIFFLFYMRLVDMATAYETLSIFKEEETKIQILESVKEFSVKTFAEFNES